MSEPGEREPGREGRPPGSDSPSIIGQVCFRELFQKHNAVMFLMDLGSLRMLEANQSCLDFYGYDREEFRKLHAWDLDTTSEAEVRAKIAEARGLAVPLFRLRHRLRDGQVRDVELRGTAVSLPGGGEVGFVVLNDITLRRRREEELRRSEERYRLLVENAHELVMVLQDGLIRFANPGALEVTGYTVDELLNRPFLDFVLPEDRQEVLAHHRARLEGQPLPQNYRLRITDGGGRTRWLEASGVVVEWEGRPAVLSFLSDVTQRQQAEETRAMGDRLQAAIETAGAACHELSQPLQALWSQLELLLFKLEPENALRPGLEAALEQVGKLAAITQRLNRITHYRTKEYLDEARILDLEKSSSGGETI